jgi:dTDP-4-dehydrorhamnose reductase
MKILVTGAAGMLGSDLLEVLKDHGQVRGVDVDDFDITNRQDCLEKVSGIKPDWIINAAAFTAVDACEDQYDTAYAVNATGAANMAAAAKQSGARLVHISTDYVFDGKASEPYMEDAITNPQTKYGRSKREGEIRVINILHDRAMIIRTAWLFGAHGKNFVDTILSLADKGHPLRIVDDQIGSPTFTRDLAAGILKLVHQKATGIIHLTNSDWTSWYGFASHFLKKTHPDLQVIPIPSSEYPLPAPRPGYSVLSQEKFCKITGCSMPDWRDAVIRYVRSQHPGRLKECVV